MRDQGGGSTGQHLRRFAVWTRCKDATRRAWEHCSLMRHLADEIGILLQLDVLRAGVEMTVSV